MKRFIVLFNILALSAYAVETKQDDKYKVESCECTLKKDVNALNPWELPWNNPKAMRQLLDRCTCKVQVNLDHIDNFGTLLKPGSLVIKPKK